MGLDIGPKTVALFREEIAKGAHNRVEWPDGHVRKSAFAQGTLAVAKAVAAATDAGATSIVGGGDSVAAVEQSGVADRSPTFPPAAALRSNFWLAKNFRASKRSQTNRQREGDLIAPTRNRRQLENVQNPSGDAAFFEAFKPLVAGVASIATSLSRRLSPRSPPRWRLPLAPTSPSRRRTCTGKKRAPSPAKFPRP